MYMFAANACAQKLNFPSKTALILSNACSGGMFVPSPRNLKA